MEAGARQAQRRAGRADQPAAGRQGRHGVHQDASSPGIDRPSSKSHFFLDFDDRLGALQAQRHALVVALQLGMFGRQRVGLGDLGAALDRLQRLAGAGVALPTPIRQQRGIEPLAPQDRANAARPRLIDLAKYPKLVGGRERPTAWPVGEFRRGRRWRRNKLGLRPPSVAEPSASRFEGDERHDHGRM